MKTFRSQCFFPMLLIGCLTFFKSLSGDTFLVATTDDSGPGSLREALDATSITPDADTIRFAIPESDPGYSADARVWVIIPNNTYMVPPDVTIDGRIALPGGGFRPGIEIDGTILGPAGMSGFFLSGNDQLLGLVVNRCQYGIWISGPDATIKNCHVGTDPSGTGARPNGEDGILLVYDAARAVIQDNLISGNQGNGIRLFSETATGNIILNNRIGTNADGTAALANGYHGIFIQDGPHDNIIEQNLISGNAYNGVHLSGAANQRNWIRNNFVGTDALGTTALPNGADGLQLDGGANHNTIEQNLVSGNGNIGIHLSDSETSDNLVRANRVGTDFSGAAGVPNGSFGIALFNGPCHNTIGPDNVIGFNLNDGVLVDGSDSPGSTVGNTITSNSIYANGRKGIFNFRSGNGELAPPVILTATLYEVTGTAGAGQTVEVFNDEDGQGQIFLGSVTVGPSGNFSLDLQVPPALPSFTATATDENGNTSEFSASAAGTEVPSHAAQIPQNYGLSQNFPNPFNPRTMIRFELPQVSKVTLKVSNCLGQEKAVLLDGEYPEGVYEIPFEPGDQESGIFIYCLTARDRDGHVVFQETKKGLMVK